ncbi:MAG: hypothetical protein U0441_38650 [Polyangiaceae bacterium]
MERFTWLTKGWMMERELGPWAVGAEKHLRASRRRVSDSLFRGTGTVWGLTAAAAEVEKNGHRTRVLVRPGMAVDALGRELCVDREQCLDVDTLFHHPIWKELAPPPESVSPSARRAYIVLRHDDTLAPVRQATVSSGARTGASGPSAEAARSPAPAPPAYVAEHFRIELCPAPPPDPTSLRRKGLAARPFAEAIRDMREVRKAFWLQEALSASPVPASADEAAPLLLAILDLDVAGSMAYLAPSRVGAPNPDNRPRVVTPGTRAVAEHLYGQRLFGPG